ncbi:MAG: DUF3516 domain-containing protein, partial [Corynebacterium sp.]|nr:DUF3516 domain-containing protein [Corynebacterium sp.]
QIAGRAGRAGYDTVGTVVIEAPEHEIENFKLRKKAGQDPKKLKKLRKKAARPGEITWTENTYERLTNADPEQLQSQFRVSTSMLLNVVARPGDGYEHMKQLLRGNHDPRAKQNKDILTAIELFRGLLAAGIVERVPDGPDATGRIYHLTEELQRDFALNQPLAPFALAALELLDKESDTYTLDIISVFEAILDDPRQVLIAQQKAERGEEIAALKAEGVDYNERMAIVEEITWPKPLEELLDQAYNTYAEGHPWVKEFELSPKSVVRDMIEHAMTFSDLIATYGLARAEGVVLRYLTDAWRTLQHSVPKDYVTEELEDIIIWLGELVRQVDSSLIDEWAQMADPEAPISSEALARELAFGVEDHTALTANQRAFTIMVRNAMFRIVELFAYEKEDLLEELTSYMETPCDFGVWMDNYFDEYADLDTGPSARGPEYFQLEKSGRMWQVRQILKDPDNDNAFAFTAMVNLDASDDAGEVRFASLTFEAH